MKAIDRLISAVDMTAKPKSIELPDGTTFDFFASPLTSAEREQAMKNAGEGAASASKFSMELIVNKTLDENGRKVFQPGEAAQLRREVPSKVVDALLTAILDNAEEEEEAETDPKSTTRKSST